MDKQLFPSKAMCPFTQYTPTKSDKTGQKYWLAVDVESKYLLNWFPYVGKDEYWPDDKHVSDYIVMRLI